MRKPLIIAAVAGSAAVITIGAISLNGEDRSTVDPVSAAPRSAVTDQTPMRARPPRMDTETAAALPERPDDEIRVDERRRPGDDDDDERRGRRGWGRSALENEPMSAEEWSERFEAMQSRRQEFMDRFDANGDGEIDDAEREAIRDHFRQRREEMRERRMVERYDTDGDGQISDAERMEMEAEREARRVEWQARMTERFDTDGDGQLSDAESAAAREQFNRDRGRGRGGDDRGGRGGGRDRWQEAINRYDADGDGELNLDESYTAYLDQHDERARREFSRRYDSNEDGGVDAADFNAFLSEYENKSESADINGDGVVDQRDIERFRDLMTLTGP